MSTYANYISNFKYDKLENLEKLETEDTKVKFNYNILSEIPNLPAKIENSEFLKMIYEISNKGTQFYYNIDKRNEIEFYGAYRDAIKRKVPLNEVRVVNLNFTIAKCKINKSESVQASMLITEDKVEWILVFPCSTLDMIAHERKIYLDIAKDLLVKGKIESEREDDLLENLDVLEKTVSERCTQTLIHEYGHILNWRIFSSLNLEEDVIGTKINCLHWFNKIGYFQNVAKRKIGFMQMDFHDWVSLLKESFAEDYRIGICLKEIDKYVLPNTICNIGDLCNEDYMKEGISIVMKQVEEYKSNESEPMQKVTNSEEEIDRVAYANEEYKLLKKLNFEFDFPSDEEIERQFELCINTLTKETRRVEEFKGVTFIEKCIEGDALLEQVDDYIRIWNDSNYNCKLHEFLGLTEEENKLWNENSLGLELILEAREMKQSIGDYLKNMSEYQLAARAESEEEAIKIKKWLLEQGKVV